jgi:hypothetical protein
MTGVVRGEGEAEGCGGSSRSRKGSYTMRRVLADGRRAALALALFLVLIAGCPPRGGPALPAAPPLLPVQRAVAIVDDNLAGITQTLSGGGIDVRAVFHDEGTIRRSSFLGTLRFLPPRFLYLELNLVAEPAAIVLGSNEEIFWVAVKLGRNELWWGRWADVEPERTCRVPLAPDMILAAMGLAPLPGPRDGLTGPVPQADDGQYYKLLYMVSSGGALWIQREYWLDRFPPYLPRAVLFRLPDGRVQMRSTLDRYERVAGSGVYVARQIQVLWPQTDDSLWMRMGRLRFNPDIKANSRAYQIRTTIPRDRWIRVGEQPRPEPAPASVPAAGIGDVGGPPDGQRGPSRQ